jgi:hypothetical protein
MKFTASVIAVAFAIAAPSVSGTSADKMISQKMYNRFQQMHFGWRLEVGSVDLEFVTNESLQKIALFNSLVTGLILMTFVALSIKHSTVALGLGQVYYLHRN